MDPLSSDAPAVNQADSGVSIPVNPTTGNDGGVSQLPPPLTTNPNPSDDGGMVGPCEAQTIQTTPSIPDMLIVLDRSGSMNMSANSPTDRWGGSRSAISQVTQDYDDNIHFGLMTFPAFVPNGGASTDSCNAGTVNVPVGVQTGDEIALTLQAMNARGNTPTSASLDVARTTLGPVEVGPDIHSVAKYVLLVTDGDPNCSGMVMGNEVDQPARAATVAAIQALSADGIKTYVVGFETAGTSFEGQLDAMAAAGNTGATTHRSVSSGDDLADALKEVAAMVRSCDFSLNKPVANALFVSVEVDGVRRAIDRTSDGWTLGKDMQTVTLTGDSCASVKNGATLDIEVQCEPVPPVN